MNQNSSKNKRTQPSLVARAFMVAIALFIVWVLGKGVIFILEMVFSSMRV